MFPLNRFVIVVYEQSVIPLSVWNIYVAKELLKPGDNLFKGLFID